MKILFLQDFQGVETGGKFYERGQVVVLDDSVAARLVADKRAEALEEKQPTKPIVREIPVENDYGEEIQQSTAKRKRGYK
jgi:hypothetical protein